MRQSDPRDRSQLREVRLESWAGWHKPWEQWGTRHLGTEPDDVGAVPAQGRVGARPGNRPWLTTPAHSLPRYQGAQVSGCPGTQVPVYSGQRIATQVRAACNNSRRYTFSVKTDGRHRCSNCWRNTAWAKQAKAPSLPT